MICVDVAECEGGGIDGNCLVMMEETRERLNRWMQKDDFNLS